MPFRPARAAGTPIEYVVTLEAPLGDRTVVDPSTTAVEMPRRLELLRCP
jgi:hypothetical protein